MKPFLALVLAITLIFAGHSLFANDERQASVSLTYAYQDYNNAYFDGKLPRNLKVYLGPAEGNAGITIGVGSPTEEYIEINPKYNPIEQELHLSLLHEMCHVSVGYSEFEEHGPRWQRCMHRLSDERAFEDLW